MFFRYYVHLTSQHDQFLYTGYFSHILHLDIIKSVQIESENEEYPYIWFSMGIDHSNPYIHSEASSSTQRNVVESEWHKHLHRQ